MYPICDDNNNNNNNTNHNNKNKAILAAGRRGLWGFEMLRIPQYLDNQLRDGGKVVSIMHRPQFSPRNIFWYSFLLEAE
jgi:hypothetical protein